MCKDRILTPGNTRPWLEYVAAKALKELARERRQKEFRQTLERVRRMRNYRL